MDTTDIRDFDTLKAVVAAGRQRDEAALDVRSRPVPYSYHDLCTNIWKAGNLLGHYGVHGIGELAVVVGPKTEENNVPFSSQRGRLDSAEALLALFGGAIIGAVVDLTPTEPIDAPAVVAPAHAPIETAPGCSRLSYGGPPTDPAVSHFERELWSENPIEPPETVVPEDDALRIEESVWTHEQLLSAAADVIEEYSLDATTRVVLETGIIEPDAFIAGILAPLAVGATVVLPENGSTDTDEPGDTVADKRSSSQTRTTGTVIVSEDGDGFVDVAVSP